MELKLYIVIIMIYIFSYCVIFSKNCCELIKTVLFRLDLEKKNELEKAKFVKKIKKPDLSFKI